MGFDLRYKVNYTACSPEQRVLVEEMVVYYSEVLEKNSLVPGMVVGKENSTVEGDQSKTEVFVEVEVEMNVYMENEAERVA